MSVAILAGVLAVSLAGVVCIALRADRADEEHAAGSSSPAPAELVFYRVAGGYCAAFRDEAGNELMALELERHQLRDIRHGISRALQVP